MKITKVSLTFMRGFIGEHEWFPSQGINIFVGQNNSGKSTILNSLLMPQNPGALASTDITLGRHQGKIQLTFQGVETYVQKHQAYPFVNGGNHNKLFFEFNRNGPVNRSASESNGERNQYLDLTNNIEPLNIFYPYLSKRKVASYNVSVGENSTNSVTGDFTNLYAKIDRLNGVNFPHTQEYQTACTEIIGFPISTVASGEGKVGGYLIGTHQYIPLSSMGEGVPNLLGLIVDLCIADNKIFVIEEPENDIHPKALKALLELIARKSKTNQFFISTHSNIVTKYLGSIEEAKVFRVSTNFKDDLPNSSIQEVGNNEAARRELLEELGYEFQDYDLHKAWLFLEESSAEVVIRDFLIPNFIEGLQGKIKTFSANGVSKLRPKLDDFNRLFVFLHLQPIYKNRVWVIVDEGASEKAILDEMKAMYGRSGWGQDQFLQLEKHNFEEYYPASFAQKVSETLAINDEQLKRKKKKDLIEEVKQWWADNPEQAKKEFKVSAGEVVNILKNIEKQLTTQ